MRDDKEINGRVSLLMTGGGLYKAFQERSPKSLKPRLSFPLFNGYVLSGGDSQNILQEAQRLLFLGYQLKPQSFIFSFLGLDKKCDYKNCKSQYRQNNSQPESKVNKEFTGQGYRKYSLGNISQVTRSKFSTGFINYIHRFNFIKINKLCQGESWRNS